MFPDYLSVSYDYALTKERKLQLEDIDVKAKLLPRFHLKPLRKLIDDKLVNNEALLVVTEMRDKMEDPIKAKECSNKAKLHKKKRKTQQTLFDYFEKVNPQETVTVKLDPEGESSSNLSQKMNDFFLKLYYQY